MNSKTYRGHAASSDNRFSIGRMAVSVVGLLTLAGVMLPLGTTYAAQGLVEEIVVTARKREESLQDIPVAITAITGESMERRGLDTFNAVINSVPQMMLTEGGAGSGATITMRGIGSTWFNQGLEQKVAVNLDGVYYGRGRVIHEGMLDLAQLEVLKGPQSLFFGKNTVAGVLSLTSNDPGDEFELIVRSGYEFENEELSGEVIVSGPVTDQLGLRAAFKGSKMYGGWMQNTAVQTSYGQFTGEVSDVPAPSENEWPGDKNLQGRLTAVFTPNDQWEFKLKASFSDFERQGSSGTAENTRCAGAPLGSNPGLGVDVPPGFSQSSAALGGAPESCGSNDGRDRVYGQNPFPTLMAQSNPDYGDGELFTKYDAYAFTGIADYSGENFSVNVVLNYQYEDTSWLGDYDYTNAAIIYAWEDSDYDAFSAEARFLTEFDSSVNMMFGVFYQKTDTKFDQDVNFFGLSDINAADPANSWVTHNKDSGTKGETVSAFVQGIWEINEDWEFSAGLRYTDETKDSFFSQPYVSPIAVILGLYVPDNLLTADQSFDNWSPEATLSWFATENITVYAAYKTGYLSGGFSLSAIDTPLIPDPVDALTFDKEEADGFEVGVRGTVLDGTLRFDITAYTYDFNDWQTDFFNSQQFAFITFNAATATTDGVEMSLDYAPPGVDGLVLHGSLNYNKAKYSDFEHAPCYTGQTPAGGCTLDPTSQLGYTQDLSGAPTALAPPWTATFGFDYDWQVGGNYMAGITVAGRYSDSYVANTLNTPTDVEGSYVNLDASVRFGTTDGRYQLALIGRNLTDNYVSYWGNDSPSSGAGTGTAQGILADRATISNVPLTLELVGTLRL